MKSKSFLEDMNENDLSAFSQEKIQEELHKIWSAAVLSYGKSGLGVEDHINRLVYGKTKGNRLWHSTRISLFDTKVSLSKKKTDIIKHLMQNCFEPHALLAVARVNWQFIHPKSEWVLIEW